MSSTVTVTGVVTDAAGATGNFSINVVLDSFTLAAVVSPASAPAGTTRTLTVTPTGGTAPFTYATPVGTGLTFAPVSPGKWTFVL